MRPSNIYGPGQEGPAGFGIIKTILQHMKSGVAMDIWGDGKTLRDYLFIDLVDAITQVQQKKCTGTYNVGMGIGNSVDDLINLCQSITGRKLSVNKKKARAMDVNGIVLDCGRLKNATGWAPAIDLATGISLTWNWLRQRP